MCEDVLNIDAMEDVRILVLLFKMGANEKPAQITREEWKNGCTELGLDSSDKFQKILPRLDLGFLEHDEFRKFYKVRQSSFLSLYELQLHKNLFNSFVFNYCFLAVLFPIQPTGHA